MPQALSFAGVDADIRMTMAMTTPAASMLSPRNWILDKTQLVSWPYSTDARRHARPDAAWWRSSRSQTSNTRRRIRSGAKR
jgi:hypothetical protein